MARSMENKARELIVHRAFASCSDEIAHAGEMTSFGALEGRDIRPPHRARPQKQKVSALRPPATTLPFHEKPKDSPPGLFFSFRNNQLGLLPFAGPQLGQLSLEVGRQAFENAQLLGTLLKLCLEPLGLLL
jgi:hypothetical protein